jgi:hypothetical protein
LVHEGGSVELEGMWLGWRVRRARIIGADGVGIWGRLSLGGTVVGESWLGNLIMRPMKKIAGCMVGEKVGENRGQKVLLKEIKRRT